MKNKFLLFSLILLFGNIVLAQKEVPDVKLETLENKSIDIKEETNKGIYLLSFWATWCAPCINELDAIADVYEDWVEETNVKLIAISIDDSRTSSKVKTLLNGKGWEYDILLDKNQNFKRALNISNIPYVVLVKDGKIQYEHSSYSPGQEDLIFDEIKKVANEK